MTALVIIPKIALIQATFCKLTQVRQSGSPDYNLPQLSRHLERISLLYISAFATSNSVDLFYNI